MATGDLSPVKVTSVEMFFVSMCVYVCSRQRKCLEIQFFLLHRNEYQRLQLKWSAIETIKKLRTIDNI